MNIQDKEVTWNGKDGEVKKALKEIVGAKDIYEVSGLSIMTYSGCKKLYKETKLKFAGEPKLVCTPTEDNKQQHIWLIGLVDSFGEVFYSDGEASRFNTGKLIKDATGKVGYSEMNEIDAKYRSRMAYKRAFCRAVLDALGFEEVYSAEDTRDFKLKDQDINSADIESL